MRHPRANGSVPPPASRGPSAPPARPIPAPAISPPTASGARLPGLGRGGLANQTPWLIHRDVVRETMRRIGSVSVVEGEASVLHAQERSVIEKLLLAIQRLPMMYPSDLAQAIADAEQVVKEK